MKTTKSMMLAGVIGVAAIMSGVTFAKSSPTTQAAPVAQADQGAQAKTSVPTLGQVQNIDKATGKITIQHNGPLSDNLPSATVTLQPLDQNMLTQVKAGDKVEFISANDGGNLLLVDIRKAK
jgi:Cu/Ag efflux protein CusF